MAVRPGLVGGHCIGVDPYYLTHKAEEIGHHPEVILAGRRINDRMGKYVVNQFVRLMGRKGLLTGDLRVLVLGFEFKENCPDPRNRSEEHTSELQSLMRISYAVVCLKKKKQH